MSNDAPANFVNPPDSMATTDTYLPCSTWIGWRAISNARHAYEKVIRGEGHAGDSRQVFPHAHGVQVAAPECGLVVRRDIINDLYTSGAVNDEAVHVAISTGDWTELSRGRGFVAGFVDVASEVYFQNTQPVGGEAVLFRLESCDANDSAACDAADADLTEAPGDHTAHAGSLDWHTINESAGTGKELTIAAGSSTDPGDTTSEREFILSAKASGGSCTVYLAAWRVFEIVTGDL